VTDVVAPAVSVHRGPTLDALLCARGSRRVASVESRPSIWRSSAEIAEIDVQFDDGTRLELVAKAVAWSAMSAAAQRAKPRFLWNNERERATYEHILQHADLGCPQYFGSFVNDAGVTCLLLERVCGVPLWQSGDYETWRDAARWLARLHARVDADAVTNGPASPHLRRYDREFYDIWLRRARRFHPGSDSALMRLIVPHLRVVEWLIEEPATFIHGECYASNILVVPTDRRAIRPLDWEMAAIGPPLVDLACLLAGRWSAERRADVADAYYDERAREGGEVPRRDHYLRTLNACLFHVALLNLGWSNDWTAPPEHAHDWLGDALERSEGWR
jgi:aminoglycoside phosphotransferase (APT) family kinase protein